MARENYQSVPVESYGTTTIKRSTAVYLPVTSSVALGVVPFSTGSTGLVEANNVYQVLHSATGVWRIDLLQGVGTIQKVNVGVWNSGSTAGAFGHVAASTTSPTGSVTIYTKTSATGSLTDIVDRWEVEIFTRSR